jgi:hypothetical protein
LSENSGTAKKAPILDDLGGVQNRRRCLFSHQIKGLSSRELAANRVEALDGPSETPEKLDFDDFFRV